jgi:hypothetical protein
MTALAPDRTLSSAEAQIEFDKALNFLRQDGARLKEVRLSPVPLRVAIY